THAAAGGTRRAAGAGGRAAGAGAVIRAGDRNLLAYVVRQLRGIARQVVSLARLVGQGKVAGGATEAALDRGRACVVVRLCGSRAGRIGGCGRRSCLLWHRGWRSLVRRSRLLAAG